jgi:anti-sigma B factor antagonist
VGEIAALLAVTHQPRDGVHVVHVSGELDLSTAADLCHELDVARTAAWRIVVDLADVDFCDSTGLRALVGAAREVQIAAGRIAVAAPPGSPAARLLTVTGAREFLTVADSAAEALAAV